MCLAKFHALLGDEHSAPNLHPVTFGRMHGCLLDFPDWLLPLRLLFLDSLPAPGVGGSEGGAAFGVGFARS